MSYTIEGYCGSVADAEITRGIDSRTPRGGPIPYVLCHVTLAKMAVIP